MSKAIIVIALIVAVIAVYPYVVNISGVSQLKGSYVVKWSGVPVLEKGDIYQKDIQLCGKINNWIKIFLEIAGIFVVILTVIEYYKFHKIYKEETRE